MKNLYISDLDGTLLNNKAELTEYSLNELNKLIHNGLNFTIATARTSYSTEVVLKGLNLNIPIILMNGVILYDFIKKEYLKVNYMEPSVVKAVVSVIKEVKINCFVYEIKDGVFSTYYENLEKKQHFDF
jgi:HAD superfamily hydrolase (TIGR01484 family)